jgi:hypothetical protein
MGIACNIRPNIDNKKIKKIVKKKQKMEKRKNGQKPLT